MWTIHNVKKSDKILLIPKSKVKMTTNLSESKMFIVADGGINSYTNRLAFAYFYGEMLMFWKMNSFVYILFSLE